jgi:hypothetical protein
MIYRGSIICAYQKGSDPPQLLMYVSGVEWTTDVKEVNLIPDKDLQPLVDLLDQHTKLKFYPVYGVHVRQLELSIGDPATIFPQPVKRATTTSEIRP